MNLSVLERMVLLKILPQEADYASLKIMNNLRMSLAFTESELKEFGVETTITDDGKTRTTWTTDREVDIPIGEKATDIIVDALKRLNREKKLTRDDMGVYEKFIPTTE